MVLQIIFYMYYMISNLTSFLVGSKEEGEKFSLPNSFDDGWPKLNPEDAHGATFLISDTCDDA